MNPTSFFNTILRFRWSIIFISLMLFTMMAIHIPKLEKDTGANAFIDPQSPALIAREKVKEIFGLSDPIVIAVLSKGDQGIYNAQTLNTIGWITDNIARLDNIDPARVSISSLLNLMPI